MLKLLRIDLQGPKARKFYVYLNGLSSASNGITKM